MTKISLQVAASKISILVNLVFFSWATAISLPLRTYPKVLKTTLVLPLMGLSKFMGILSLTVAHLLLVKACFKSLGYHSLLFHLMQFILAFVVAAQITNSLCRHANFAQVFIYNSGLALIYTILFVHPVQDCGKLWYFMYYLMKCLTEMCFMYMVGLDGHYLLLMTYYCLYIFGVGLLTLSFGLASLFKSVSSSLPTESWHLSQIEQLCHFQSCYNFQSNKNYFFCNYQVFRNITPGKLKNFEIMYDFFVMEHC